MRISDWQPNSKGTAATRAVTGRRKTSFVQLEQLAGHSQADSQPSLAAVEGTLALNKQIENSRQQLRCDTRPVVTDLDHRVPLVFIRVYFAALMSLLQLDPTLRDPGDIQQVIEQT